MFSQETVEHLARAVAAHTGRDFNELMREAATRHPHADYSQREAAVLVLIGRLTACLAQPPCCVKGEAGCAAIVQPVDGHLQLFG